ncbi:putative thiol protease-related [Anaeramoeba flamelloides]|uniref:Thiol protease-related n=1 Tax=Anaeramoeba flamelloides TaxID=1746091 RepID=A0AAV7ZL37_9EUKA|nr:putative thiol protease-related [Anaeramoeba flamelloides]
MKLLSLILTLLFLLLPSFLCLSEDRKQFEEFKIKYNKAYESATKEEQAFNNFVATKKFIDTHNSRTDLSYKLGMNQFGDLYSPKEEDYSYRSLTGKIDETAPQEDTINWNTVGAVTAVPYEGICASSWAFGAIGAIESAAYLASDILQNAAAQELIDCVPNNYGCYGGRQDIAFDWVKSNGGLCVSNHYSYSGKDGICQSGGCSNHFFLTGHTMVDEGDEDKLQSAVKGRPVAAAIDSSLLTFLFYKSGVYSDESCSKTEQTHVVLIVGYGTTGGENYWILRNSYGKGWGDEGYMLLLKGGGNECGIASNAFYPTGVHTTSEI